MAPSSQHRRHLKTRQLPVIFELCLRRTRSEFSKSFVFKMFPGHTKAKDLRFQIPPV